MVEMIPHADTLRKIQVEHGVTGSFKDRPLADWLLKHNPTDEQYDKVHNPANTPVYTFIPVTDPAGLWPTFRCICPTGSGELHLLVCWLLCGHLHPGNL